MKCEIIKVGNTTFNYCDVISNSLGEDFLQYCSELAQFFDRKIPFKKSLYFKGAYFVVAFNKDHEISIGSKNLFYEHLYLSTTQNMEIQDFLRSFSIIPESSILCDLEKVMFDYNLKDFSQIDSTVFDKATVIQERIISDIETYHHTPFEKLSDYFLSLTANYELFRVHILKFVAILPCLEHDKSGSEVKDVFLETLRRLVLDSKDPEIIKKTRTLPVSYVIGAQVLQFISKFIPAKVLSFCIKKSVSFMAKRFIAGTTIEKSSNSFLSLKRSQREATLDQLGELVVSTSEANLYTEKVLEIINGLSKYYVKGEKNAAGILKSHVSIKVSALCEDFKPYAFDYTYEKVAPRLKKILSCAHKNEVFVNIDAEHYDYRDCVWKIYQKVLLSPEFKDYDQTGIVVQAYLRDGSAHLDEVIEFARTRKLLMPIRLVKGAYWDAETIEAKAHSFQPPEFLDKAATDLHFRQLVIRTLDNGDAVQLAIASHNIVDHAFARAFWESRKDKAPMVEHQCLHMTYEPLSEALAKLGYPTRNYIPIGDLLVGMAYLVRRIMENSSQVGVLSIMRSHKKIHQAINFQQDLDEYLTKTKKEFSHLDSFTALEFKNIHPLRPYLKSHLEMYKVALDRFNPLSYNFGPKDIQSPNDFDEKVGSINHTTTSEVNSLIDDLASSHQTSEWATNFDQRALAFIKVASKMLERRDELSVLIMKEAGKTLNEAYADVDEAIDFIHFYLLSYKKFHHKYHEFKPRGVVGVIAPWNFPLAICVGMSAAPLIAGNHVIVKPAEQTPVIAQVFYEICLESGVPSSSFSMVHGGAQVGEALTDHPAINGIVFTGSKNVGEIIYDKIMKSPIMTYENYDKEKFVITEMGGKNAIIVTNNCELDETISGILYAGFAHSGQKCSACSRIIIDEKIKPAFLERFTKAVAELKVGASTELSTTINPLIDLQAKQKTQTELEGLKKEAKSLGGVIHLDKSSQSDQGAYFGPVICELPSNKVLNEQTYASKELFAPIIHLVSYKTLDEAIALFNSTSFALTGGIYCQSQDDIDYLSQRLECGNLYVNRPNTGARVGIEPFGGYKLSGTGPKAGSDQYLRMFMDKNLTRVEQIPSVAPVMTEYFPAKINSFQQTKEKRRAKIVKAIELILKEASFILGEQFTKDYALIQDLKNWFEDDSNCLYSHQLKNTVIPGQLSFDELIVGNGRSLVISQGCLISTNFIFFIIYELYQGNGIQIVTSNKDIDLKWATLVKCFHQAGIGKGVIDSYLVTRSNIARLVNRDNFYRICYDDWDNDQVYDLTKDSFTKLVHVSHSSFEFSAVDYLQFHSLRKSFAVNTMRHGAPLSLGSH